jgi:hypothetical protein
VGGTSINAIVSGGTQYGSAGDVASNPTIEGGGYQDVFSGGIDDGLQLANDSADVLKGAAISAAGFTLVQSATPTLMLDGSFDMSG